MAARNNVGDIYKVSSSGFNHYFQYCIRDFTQLDGEVIAVFSGKFKNDLDVQDIVNLDIDFFTHTTIRLGIPRYWHKVGHDIPADTSKAIFYDVDSEREDLLKMHSQGLSNHWCEWRINEDRRYIGEETRISPQAELGLLFSPETVHSRITTGKYGITYFGKVR